MLQEAVQRRACRLAADVSFAKGCEHLEVLLGVKIAAETIRTLAEGHGQAMARFHQDGVATAFREVPGEVELAVDAGKVYPQERGSKELRIAVLQKREAGPGVRPEQWDQRRLPSATAKVAWGAMASAKRSRRSWRP